MFQCALARKVVEWKEKPTPKLNCAVNHEMIEIPTDAMGRRRNQSGKYFNFFESHFSAISAIEAIKLYDSKAVIWVQTNWFSTTGCFA